MQHSELLHTLQTLTKEKVTQQKIANALGVNVGTIGARASRNSNYDTLELAKIGQNFGVNLLDTDVVNIITNVTSASDNDANVISVDYYPDEFGKYSKNRFITNKNAIKVNIPIFLFQSYNAEKQYSLIKAVGDSMTPFIKDNDKLLVEHLEEDEQIKDNKIYVFIYNEKIFCKRLIDHLDHLVIKSDNSQYQPLNIKYTKEKKDIKILGRVVGLLRSVE